MTNPRNLIPQDMNLPEAGDAHIINSSWRQHPNGLFGQGFKYTDATDLPGDFSKPGTRWPKKPGQAYKEPLWQRFRTWLFKKQPPLAWLVVDPDLIRAYIVATHQEVRTSVAEPGVIMPVYKDSVVLGFAQYADDEESNGQGQ